MSTNVLAFPSSADVPQTMSSREIAELTGKRHDNVMRDITTMLQELGGGGLLRFEDTHTNLQNGQAYRVFNLPKRETLILVSGYNVQMRARIIDRWQELETRQVVPQLSRNEIIRNALLLVHEDLEQERALRMEREYQLLENSPKVEFYNTVVSNDGNLPLAMVAKLTVHGPLQFNAFLRSERILQPVTGTGIHPEREYLNNGWFVMHEEPMRNGKPYGFNRTAWITPEGISGLWERYGLSLFKADSSAARAKIAAV